MRLIIIPIICVTILLGPKVNAADVLRERPMVPPAWSTVRVNTLNRYWVEILAPEIKYNANAVSVASNYKIISFDDPAYAGGISKSPLVVEHRHFPEVAPYADSPAFGDVLKLNMIYRVYLKMPSPLIDGKHYLITINSTVGLGGPYAINVPAAGIGSDRPNDVIHVNQVAYLAKGPKIAYLSAWTGQSAIPLVSTQPLFPTPFKLVNESTGAAVFQGYVKLDITADKEPWSRTHIYSMDFTQWTTPGRYHLSIPGVGISYSFQISPYAFNTIGYTLLRGLTHQRDGDHGFDVASRTHWTRPPAHLDDAIVESNGVRVNLVGGHMDAGDRGKYPHNTADVSASLLAAMWLYPNQVEALGETLQIRESGNGIPDLIDETIYELDFLEKAVMNTPKDGTLPVYLRPQNADGTGGYEQGQPLEGKPNRKLYDETMGPNRAETLFAAGALAMAANVPVMQKYVPNKCVAYLEAAKRAFNGFQLHTNEASFFKEKGNDQWKEGPTPWADEMLVAAANLFQATGDSQYLQPLQAALPSDLKHVKRWGWVLNGPWLAAYVTLYKSDALAVALPSLKVQAKEAIVNWGDCTKQNDSDIWNPPVKFTAPFGAPLPNDAYNQVGWYFSGDQVCFPAMIAYGVTGDVKYRDVLIKTWSYLLGGNALSRSFISGLGDPQRSPRWMTHEIGQYQW